MALIEREALIEGRVSNDPVVIAAMCAPTIDPIRAAGGCRCGECRHRDTTACPAYDAPMGRTSLRIKFCSEGEQEEAKDDD